MQRAIIRIHLVDESPGPGIIQWLPLRLHFALGEHLGWQHCPTVLDNRLHDPAIQAFRLTDVYHEDA